MDPLISASVSARLDTRIELARTSLLNVQHWFDHGTELLAHGPLGDWQTLVINVERHLIVAIAALRDSRAKSPRLTLQLDATTRATNGFWYALLAWCSRKKLKLDRTLEKAMDRIYEKIDRARVLLGLSHELGDAPYVHAALAEDAYGAMALGPVLGLVRIEAEYALAELGGKDAIASEIAEYASCVLERHVEHAVWLADVHPGNEAAFASVVEGATLPVLALGRVLAERLAKLEIHARLDRVIAGLAALRIATCLAA